jgi:glutamate/tyrosine decarboxylase-like PLP-dependent enzyme
MTKAADRWWWHSALQALGRCSDLRRYVYSRTVPSSSRTGFSVLVSYYACQGIGCSQQTNLFSACYKNLSKFSD